MNKRISLFNAAKMIAIVAVFSKMVGFLRDVVIAGHYGASTVSDAYFYAYQIPALAIIILGGVGGPFHSAVVAVFAKMLPKDDMKATIRTNKLYCTFLTGICIIFGLISILVFLYSEQIIGLIAAEGSRELISLASIQLKIMTPIIFTGGIIGVYYGILVTFGEFLLPNISPVVMSLVIISGVLLTPNDPAGYALAISTTIGAFIQLGIQMPKVHKFGFKFRPRLPEKKDIELRQLWELLFPAILSSTVGQLYVYADMFFASGLEEGAWSAIGYANRIFQFPVGILMSAFLVPLFPLFSRLAGEKKYDEIREYFHKGTGMLNLIGFPISIAILLLASDGVYLIFQRGNFGANATQMVSTALIFLGLGIIPYVFRDSITRIYYAFNDSKTPFIVAFSSILIKIALNFILVKPFGIGGITLSTTLVTLINAFLLGIFVKKKIDLQYGIYFKNLGKQICAGVVAFLGSFAVYGLIPAQGWFQIAIKTSFMLILCMFLFIAAAFVFRVNYIKETGLKLYESIARRKNNG